jgi:Polyketide cyclase / dehydrase and lipid transport
LQNGTRPLLEIVRLADTIAAPIGEVWGVIAAFGALKAWIPGVASCSQEGDGVGAIRRIRSAFGVADERLEASHAGEHRIVYRVLDPAPLPMKGIVGSMQLTALDPTSTRLDWVIRADALDAPREQLQALGTAFCRDSIAGLKKLLDCG